MLVVIRFSFFFLKMKNEKQVLYFVFCFFVKNEKRMKKLKIQSKISIEHQEIGNLLDFHFYFCTKNENKYSILNFVFQFIMKMK